MMLRIVPCWDDGDVTDIRVAELPVPSSFLFFPVFLFLNGQVADGAFCGDECPAAPHDSTLPNALMDARKRPSGAGRVCRFQTFNGVPHERCGP